ITASLSRQSKGDGGSGGGKLADNITVCTISAARSLRNFRCVKITDIVTQPRKGNSYRRFIGRSAGKRRRRGAGEADGALYANPEKAALDAAFGYVADFRSGDVVQLVRT